MSGRQNLTSYYSSLLGIAFNAWLSGLAGFILPSLLFLAMISVHPVLFFFAPLATGFMARAAILALKADRQWSRGYWFIRLVSHWLQHLAWFFLLVFLPFMLMLGAKIFHAELPGRFSLMLTAGLFVLASLKLWPLLVSNFLAGHYEFNQEIIGFPGIRDQWIHWGPGARVVRHWTKLNGCAFLTTIPSVTGVYLCLFLLVLSFTAGPPGFLLRAAVTFVLMPITSLILIATCWLALLQARREVPEFNLFELMGKLKTEIPADYFAPQFFRTQALIDNVLRQPPKQVRQMIISPKDFETFCARMRKDLPHLGKSFEHKEDQTVLIYSPQKSLREVDPPDIVVGFEDQKGIIILAADLVSPLETEFNSSVERWGAGILLGGDIPRNTL